MAVKQIPRIWASHCSSLRKISIAPDRNSLLSDVAQDKLGAGAFTVLFQNTSDGERNQLPADFLDLARFTKI
ncbi:hypothetical protein QUA30_21095 [Microcoleus sp. Pol14C2]|uniref:hypothetical protein n=1 Tax=unclassified Microcoleus TaxID=2642155 RepID=UPI002FD6E9FC